MLVCYFKKAFMILGASEPEEILYFIQGLNAKHCINLCQGLCPSILMACQEQGMKHCQYQGYQGIQGGYRGPLG